MSDPTGADAPKSEAKPSVGKITREEHRALLNLHMGKIRLAKLAVEEARGPFDAAKEELTAAFHEARADLGKGYTRKRLAALLEDITNRLRNLLKEEEDRHQDRVDLGLPIYGAQADLFAGADDRRPQEVKDEAFWFAEGALVGRLASERKAPEGCPPRMDQHFLRGYDAGQAEVGRLFIEAQEAKKRLAEPAADQKPVDLSGGAAPVPDPEPTVDEEKAAERRSIRRAKESLAAMGAPANEVAA